MPVTLLHLSDVHYGDDFIPWAIKQRRGWGRRPRNEIVAGLTQAVRDLKPAYVILSGDFVNKASASSFSESANFLRGLLTNAGIDIQRQVLLAPGNHDVGFFGRKPDAQKRLAKYNAFARQFYGSTNLYPVANYIKRDTQNKLLFLVLDTTLKSAAPAAEGEVGTEQRNWLRNELESLRSELGHEYDRYAKIAVMHHHCLGIPGSSVAADRNMQLMDGAAILKDLKSFAFDLVLHGHRHVPRDEGELRSDGGIVTIVGAGTVLAPYPDQQSGCGNNFNALKIDHERRKVFLTRHQAREDGTFAANTPPTEYSLFPVPPQRFRQEKIRMIERVEESGDTFVTVERRGIQVVGKPGIKHVPIRIAQFAAGSTIKNFEFGQGVGCTAKFRDAMRPDNYEGVIEFDNILTAQDPPKTVSYSFEVEKGTYMKAPGRGSAAEGFDETTIALASVTDELEIELELPKGFQIPRPKVIFEDSGVDRELEFQQQYDLRPDMVKNTWTLKVSNPPLNVGITLRWILPKNWP